MIFQDPMTSLNPVLTISRQIRKPRAPSQDERARPEADHRLLDLVGIPSAKKRVDTIPTILRRHASARDDRDGALVQPELILRTSRRPLDVTIQRRSDL